MPANTVPSVAVLSELQTARLARTILALTDLGTVLKLGGGDLVRNLLHDLLYLGIVMGGHLARGDDSRTWRTTRDREAHSHV